MDERKTDYLEIYLEDTDQQLGELYRTVTIWQQQSPGDTDEQKSLRLLHAMEGSAGAMGFGNVHSLTREMHVQLERVLRAGDRVDPQAITRLLKGISFLGECNQRLRCEETLADSEQLLDELHAAMDKGTDEPS